MEEELVWLVKNKIKFFLIQIKKAINNHNNKKFLKLKKSLVKVI